jgi:hypothetical protein
MKSADDSGDEEDTNEQASGRYRQLTMARKIIWGIHIW